MRERFSKNPLSTMSTSRLEKLVEFVDDGLVDLLDELAEGFIRGPLTDIQLGAAFSENSSVREQEEALVQKTRGIAQGLRQMVDMVNNSKTALRTKDFPDGKSNDKG